jgi:glycosyltransferase involved in cell wall biosynthesis
MSLNFTLVEGDIMVQSHTTLTSSFDFGTDRPKEHTGVVDISVIIPVYNAEPYLVRCIEALELQDYPRDRYEIIMVDNNSTDNSREIIRQYPSIRLLHEPKQGAYAARNRGVASALGLIVAFTDPDCVPGHNWLRTIAGVMKDPEVGMVMGRRSINSQSVCLSLLNSYMNCRDEYVCNSHVKELYYGYTNNMAVRRWLLGCPSPFIERRRGADSIFVNQIVERYSCDLVRYCSEMQVNHLEICSLKTVYQKFFIYGRSGRLMRGVSSYRPLNFREQLSVFVRTVRTQKFSPFRVALLLALLIIGVAFSHAGRLSTMILRTEA